MHDAERVFAERFEIERLAGAGGMAKVYRARDTVSGQPVALKILLSDDSGERFAREAELLSELSHESIVRYIEHGRSADGQAFIAMEWLEGESLSVRLKRLPLTPQESLELGAVVAEALGVAHSHGVVHRDVKPGNLFLVDGAAAKVKLLDFGIAHRPNAGHDFTRTGMVVGTVGYMAPEQAGGDGQVGASADLFSLGCVLFHCLTGRPAFQGGTPVAVLAKLILEEAPRVSELRPDLPEELDLLIAQLLDKSPVRRPASAADVARTLRGISVPEIESSIQTTSGRPEVLTDSERRLVCIILSTPILERHAEQATLDEQALPTRVERAPASWTEATVVDIDTVAEESGVKFLLGIAQEHGARMEPLRDGSVAVLLTSSETGTATDLCARAARCALAMRRAFPEASFALATGRGVLGDRLPVGAVIEQAAGFLEPTRATGIIVVDRVTAGLLDARFELGSGGEGSLQLLREHRSLDAVRTLLGAPTSTVGRERELAFLSALYDECESEPSARAALLVGPAGVGKSRIRYEFLHRLSRRRGQQEVWIARGDPVGAGSAFGMLSQFVRRAAGIYDGEAASTSREKLGARCGRHLPEPDALRVATFLAELARVPQSSKNRPELEAARRDAELMRDQTRRAWTDLVVAECRAGPIVLVLEDLHWGDAPSLQFVDTALARARDLPLFVLGMTRPEQKDHLSALWSERAVQLLRIGPLTRRAAERLVQEVLGKNLSRLDIQTLVARADGNAFFLEELIRSAAEGEATDALPQTLLAMVQGRLEALPEGARRLLRAGSVFGGKFWDQAVAKMIGQPAHSREVGHWLELLVAGELIGERHPSRFPTTRELVFRHDLVRQTAYEMLTEDDCALGHRLAGQWLEESGEPDAMVLAEHFARGGSEARAVQWYGAAAGEALEAHDLALALQAIERALRFENITPAERGELLRMRAEALYWKSEHLAARDCALEAMQLSPAGSDTWYAAAATFMTGAHRLGDLSAEVELTEHLLRDRVQDLDSTAAVIACSRIAVVLIQSGLFELAERLIESVAAHAERLADDPATRGRWRATLAAHALYSGRTHDYLRHSTLAAEDAASSGHARNAAVQRHNVGHAHLEMGNWREAAEQLQTALNEGAQLGLPNVVAGAKNNLGFALAQLGDVARGMELLQESIELLAHQRDQRMLGGAKNHLALVHLTRGDLAAAEEMARSAVAVLAEVPPLRCQALGTLARILLSQGRPEEALAQARLAMSELTRLQSMADGEVGVRLAFAEALLANGHGAAGQRALAEARQRLWERARLIGDERMRRSFLHDIPEHARLLELAPES